EEILRAAVADGKPEQAVKDIWWMLFDLYQITGQQNLFESISIDYLSRFETSPPSWVRPAPANPDTGSRSAPAVVFTGELDASIIKLLERAIKFSQSHSVLRLEF